MSDNIPDRYYVSKRAKPLKDEPDLAFLAYQELTSKGELSSACKKRLETMRSWCRFPYGEDVTKHVSLIDNVPMKGFQLLEVVSRYSTDNKVFRVRDPRGFVVEIYSRNLTDIAMEAGIVKGEFQGEYVWARYGPGNYLLSTQSKEFEEFNEKESLKETWTHPVVGDIVEYQGSPYLYVGRSYKVSLQESDRVYRMPWISKKSSINLKVVVDRKPWNVLVYLRDGVPEYSIYSFLRKLTSNHPTVGRFKGSFSSKVNTRTWNHDRIFGSLEELEEFVATGGKQEMVDDYSSKNGKFYDVITVIE